jgi:RNA polymerase sigma-70 factor (ECF subfamily)
MIEVPVQIGWERLTERLRGFVGRRVTGPDADDVLQNALLRIQKGLPGLRDPQRFGPWVYRVTRNAIGDHLRARARESGRALAGTDLAADASEDTDGLRHTLAGCLSPFVAALPPPYREAITKTELEGLSQKEAAERLGLSISGMKSRVQRGRERLRGMFERCCELTRDRRGRVIACAPRAAGSGPDCVPASPGPPCGD